MRRLILLNRPNDSEPIGVRARPPHITDDVPRLPGESVSQLMQRTLALMRGSGVVLAELIYADDANATAPSEGRGGG